MVVRLVLLGDSLDRWQVRRVELKENDAASSIYLSQITNSLPGFGAGPRGKVNFAFFLRSALGIIWPVP
jgi:hypothetical protein